MGARSGSGSKAGRGAAECVARWSRRWWGRARGAGGLKATSGGMATSGRERLCREAATGGAPPGGCAAQPGSHRAGSAKRAEVAARRHRRVSEGSTGRLPTTPRAPLHAPSTSAATARKETDPDLIPIPTPRTRGDAQPAMALQVTGALFVGRQAACSNGGVVLI